MDDARAVLERIAERADRDIFALRQFEDVVPPVDIDDGPDRAPP